MSALEMSQKSQKDSKLEFSFVFVLLFGSRGFEPIVHAFE